jgi:tetratricopeptide (TPR) repeat protein
MTQSVERLWNRAKQYLAMDQTEPARAALESLLVRDPTHVGALLILGGLAWTNDRVREATRRALEAKRTSPEDPLVLTVIIKALVQVGESAAAHELLQHPVLARDNLRGDTLMHLATANQMLDQHPDALACYDRARARGMAANAEFHFFRSIQLAFNNRLHEAEQEIDLCLASGAPIGRAYVEAARLRRQTPERNHLKMIESALMRVESRSMDHASLLFARYKELEDLERYDEAWQALAEANAIMAGRLPLDSARDERLLDGLLHLCSAEFLTSGTGADGEGPQPIFIIGMPRSGTTLLDRLLGSHSAVASAGELRDFGNQMRWVADHVSLLAPDERMLERLPGVDYAELGSRYLAQAQWRARGKRFFIDKLPANWGVAGLIHKALPQARILHMVREPMDVCFSNFRATFGDSHAWSYQLERLANQYRQYRKAMAHWHAMLPGRILDVSYADLVDDSETVLRQVLAFCGLAWEPGCLDPANNPAPVATLSFAQSREPVHQRSLGAWRHYAAQLEPLRTRLTP